MNALVASPYLDMTNVPLAGVPVRAARPEIALQVVCHSYQMDLDTLLYGGRHQRISEARRVAYVLLRKMGLSYPEIGRAMSRDHSTALVGHRHAMQQKAASPEFASYLDNLWAALEKLLTAEREAVEST